MQQPSQPAVATRPSKKTASTKATSAAPRQQPVKKVAQRAADPSSAAGFLNSAPTKPQAQPVHAPPQQQSGAPVHPSLRGPINANFARRYQLGPCLGSGGFGFVCSAVRLSDNVEVAVKFIQREKVPATAWARDEVLGVVPLEVYLLRRINHANIIRYLDYFPDAVHVILVTELHGGNWSNAAGSTTSSSPPSPTAPGPPATMSSSSTTSSLCSTSSDTTCVNSSSPGNSSTFTPPQLQRRSSCDLFECIELMERFTEDQARHVFRQIVSAVAYLASLGIVHRDIKDENILIDDHFNVKLIDFGSATFADHSDGLFLGTLQYAAPEVFEGRRHRGPEGDVWSLGCCLYIMLTGEVPFATPHDVKYSAPQMPKHASACKALEGDCGELLNIMLAKDMSRRATIAQVLSHKWLAF
ncbi:hypothetical protein HK101_008939 [Irineochytrium annulatum]|nr:hypothetical protein HK101_008939 [Irineochytrium annulatum]